MDPIDTATLCTQLATASDAIQDQQRRFLATFNSNPTAAPPAPDLALQKRIMQLLLHLPCMAQGPDQAIWLGVPQRDWSKLESTVRTSLSMHLHRTIVNPWVYEDVIEEERRTGCVKIVLRARAAQCARFEFYALEQFLALERLQSRLLPNPARQVVTATQMNMASLAAAQLAALAWTEGVVEAGDDGWPASVAEGWHPAVARLVPIREGFLQAVVHLRRGQEEEEGEGKAWEEVIVQADRFLRALRLALVLAPPLAPHEGFACMETLFQVFYLRTRLYYGTPAGEAWSEGEGRYYAYLVPVVNLK